ncbi:MAG: type I glyceraldehyde-3-phosphate dehydrogenase [Actinomycetota bacterium]
MTIRVGINGFGRIGRNVMRAAKQRGADIDFVAVNDLGEPETMAHLLRYDTVFGQAPFEVTIGEGEITVDGDRMEFLSERDPSQLPWRDLGADVVLECTGVFKKRDQAAAHLDAGASKVVISAPSPDADAMVVIGVNDDALDPESDVIVSNASCTTNCFAPMVKVLDDAFGVERGLITTIHAYTGTQNIVDAPHKDLRRARAGAVNLIPTSTGAAKATGQVLEHLLGKLDGMAMRVPVPAGSATDFVGNLSRSVTVDEVNEAFRAAAEGAMAGVLAYNEDPIVSSDIVGRPESCIFDGPLTMVMGGDMIKIMGWYDNEWGYSNRMIDLALRLAGAA